MIEGYFMVLVSPLTLLFLVNSLFLIFLTSSIWSFFFNLKSTRALLNGFIDVESSPLFKLVLLLPIACFALIAEYHWSLLVNINFFPLLSSVFVKLNILGTLMVLIALPIIKFYDKKSDSRTSNTILFSLSYFGLIYIFYLVILMASVVIRLNAFPDNFLHSYPLLQREKINHYVMCSLFALNFIGVFMAVTTRALWRLLLFFIYTFAISLATYLYQYASIS